MGRETKLRDIVREMIGNAESDAADFLNCEQWTGGRGDPALEAPLFDNTGVVVPLTTGLIETPGIHNDRRIRYMVLDLWSDA